MSFRINLSLEYRIGSSPEYIRDLFIPQIVCDSSDREVIFCSFSPLDFLENNLLYMELVTHHYIISYDHYNVFCLIIRNFMIISKINI